MQLFFSLIAITSIWCLGIKILTHEEMVLEKLGIWGEIKMKEGVKWVEPAFMCEWCMPSIHTLIGMAIAFGIGVIPELTYRLIFYYPIVAMGSSLLNGLIWQYYIARESEREMVNEITEASKAFIDYVDAELLEESLLFEQTNN